jgi:hypothetical protein
MSKKLDAILSQYQKNTESKGKSKISNEDRLKKYFTEKLQKGVKSQTRTFRILPSSLTDGGFTEAYFHEKEVNGTWPKTYCPKLNDEEHCPMCEARQALLDDGSEKAKSLARDLNARKWYVLKGIDRDNEDDGVKFWRFKHKWTGDGVMDKLIPLFKLKGDITDPREGRDVIIVSGRNDKNHSVVNSIMCDDVTILTEDTTKANEWIGNTETFKDVYAKKTLEYLEIVATNKTPIWDSEQKIYVAEEDKEEAESASLEKEISFMSNTTEVEDNEGVLVTDLNSKDSEEDELPF